MDEFLRNIRTQLQQHKMDYDVDEGWQKFQHKKRNKKNFLLKNYKWLAAACVATIFIVAIYFKSDNSTIPAQPTVFNNPDSTLIVQKHKESYKKNTNKNMPESEKTLYAESKEKTRKAIKHSLVNKTYLTTAALKPVALAQRDMIKADNAAVVMDNEAPVIQNATPSPTVVAIAQKNNSLPIISEAEANTIMGFDAIQSTKEPKERKVLKKIFTPAGTSIASTSSSILKVNF